MRWCVRSLNLYEVKNRGEAVFFEKHSPRLFFYRPQGQLSARVSTLTGSVEVARYFLSCPTKYLATFSSPPPLPRNTTSMLSHRGRVSVGSNITCSVHPSYRTHSVPCDIFRVFEPSTKSAPHFSHAHKKSPKAIFFCGRWRARTPDIFSVNEALYQLS